MVCEKYACHGNKKVIINHQKFDLLSTYDIYNQTLKIQELEAQMPVQSKIHG